MLSKESVNYSLRNIKTRKSRSFFTIFSIMIGITTIFIFVSFGWGLYKYVEEFSTSSSADKIIVQSKVASMVGTASSTNFFNHDDDTKNEK